MSTHFRIKFSVLSFKLMRTGYYIKRYIILAFCLKRHYSYCVLEVHYLYHSIQVVGLMVEVPVWFFNKWHLTQCSHITSVSFIDLWHELYFIPAKITNHTHYKGLDEIIDPFPKLINAAIEVWERTSNFIPYFIRHVITYLCWD